MMSKEKAIETIWEICKPNGWHPTRDGPGVNSKKMTNQMWKELGYVNALIFAFDLQNKDFE